MKTKEELRLGCAEMLKNLRIKHGLSKFKMSVIAEVNEHTWNKYETGMSAPSVPEFVALFDELGDDALKTVLDYIYPEVYKANEDPRDKMIHYLHDLANDRFVQDLDYLCFGEHGSNILPQLELFTMLDHLPMKDRYEISHMIMNKYEMAKAQGTLINPDVSVPDLALIQDATEKGKEAVYQGRNSYTTSVTKRKKQ